MFNFLFSRNFLYFIAFGGTAALVNLLCGYLLYNANVFPYIVSVFIAASAGLLVNFALNYKLNFKYKGRKLSQQFGTFLVVASIGTLLTAVVAHFSMQLLLFFEIEDIALAGFAVSSQFFAHVFSVGVITVYSFIAHKYFSFNVGIRNQLRKTIANIKSDS
ncbi:MAG: GtrA family protein [Desulfovibrio sp.]|nr:GtrA family protein [Desulfovibrio sp.]